MKEPHEIEVILVGKLEGKMALARYSMIGDSSKYVFKETVFTNFDCMQVAQDRTQLRPIVNSN